MGGNRPYYADHANHCFRFYCRYPGKDTFVKDAERRDWEAAKAVLIACDDEKREILQKVYTYPGGNLSDAVRLVARDTSRTEDDIWKMIKDATYAAAKLRGLI